MLAAVRDRQRRMQPSFAILLSLFLVRATSAVKPSGNVSRGIRPRVLDGIKVEEGEFTSVVGLMNRGYLCTGSVLNQYTVLTAAQCLEGSDTIIVYIGCVDMTTCTNKKIGVGLVHPRYHDKSSGYWRSVYDVAIVKLKEPMNTQLMPIAHPPHPDPPYTDCTTVGFGLSSMEPLKVAILYKMNLKKVVQCSTLIHADWTTNCLCALHSRGPVVSDGDSGCPLICMGKQVGILTLSWDLEQTDDTMIWSFIPEMDVQWVPFSSSSKWDSPTWLIFSLFVILLSCI